MAAIKAIRFSDRDNVAVALEKASRGDVIEFAGGRLELRDGLEAGFKAALCDIAGGGAIFKYGEPIGRALRPIKAGERVHDDNIASALTGGLSIEPWSAPEPLKEETAPPSFMGYRRKNGRVGIRSELWIIPTVGCINGLLRNIVKNYRLPAGITAVRVLEHPSVSYTHLTLPTIRLV